jgi:hypothetical protein
MAIIFGINIFMFRDEITNGKPKEHNPKETKR